MTDETKDGAGGMPRYCTDNYYDDEPHVPTHVARVCLATDVARLEADLARVTEALADRGMYFDRMAAEVGVAEEENARLRVVLLRIRDEFLTATRARFAAGAALAQEKTDDD